MKHLCKVALFWSFFVGSSSLFWGEVVLALNFQRSSSTAIQVASIVEESQKMNLLDQAEAIQEEMGDTIHQDRLILFEQMDRLSALQGDLGRTIRDHSASKFLFSQEIESIRANLNEMTGEITAFQIAISQRTGEAQEEIGRAILAARVAPPGSNVFRRAQQRLGRAIRDSAILNTQVARDYGQKQERFGRVIHDQATLLIRMSEKLGKGEERLGQMILHHAQTLHAANKTIGDAQKRLGKAISKGAQAEKELLAQF